MILDFNFDVTPMAHQSVRCEHGVFRQPNKIKDYKRVIQMIARYQLPRGFEMFEKEVPLKMCVRYYFKYRKSEKKSLVQGLCKIPKVTIPDVTDNLQKALVDSLAGIIFKQDQQIFSLVAEKYWWYKNCIHLSIFDGAA